MVGKKRIAAGALAASLSLLPAVSQASTLHVEVFNPGKDAVFPVTSTLIYGDHEAMLVDAQFQRKYAQKLVEMIKASGKTLKYIFISHSDPDYYFGLAEIKRAFPSARVLSTAQTAFLISVTKDAKLQVWGERLGADAPERLYVPDAITSDELEVDNEKVVVQRNLNDPAHSFLWIPSLETVLGGISVITGSHLWMADTSSVAEIDQWVQAIDAMASLKPRSVIPGHFAKLDTSPAQLDFVRNYLQAYKREVSASSQSARIVSEMTAKFPDLPGREVLELGAKAFTGEVAWHVASPYPPVGRTAEVNFGSVVFRLDFKDNRTMSFEGMSGQFKGVKGSVRSGAIVTKFEIFLRTRHPARNIPARRWPGFAAGLLILAPLARVLTEPVHLTVA